MPIELRLVETAEASGAYIQDRRSGERQPIAQSAALPASRHEVDDLFSVTVAAALDCDLLAIYVLKLSAAAGAANFLRHGLGTGARSVVEELAPQVQLRELD
jgi:hypothetical protein